MRKRPLYGELPADILVGTGAAGDSDRKRAINPGDERSFMVTRGHLASQVRPHNGPEGTDSQS